MSSAVDAFDSTLQQRALLDSFDPQRMDLLG